MMRVGYPLLLLVIPWECKDTMQPVPNLISDLFPILVFKGFYYVHIFSNYGRGMVKLRVPIPQFYPLLSGPLKPHKLLLIQDHCGYHDFLGPDPLFNRPGARASLLPGLAHEAAHDIKTTQEPTRRCSPRTRLGSRDPPASHLTAYGKFVMGKYSK